MIAFRTPRSVLGQTTLVVLAFLALAMKVLVPPGYMAASGPADGPPFALVLCTAQGPVPAAALPAAVQTDALGDTSGDESKDNPPHSPCVFAGHAAGAVGPDQLTVQSVRFAGYAPPAVAVQPIATPGRGLTAPPLPARGPPQLTA